MMSKMKHFSVQTNSIKKIDDLQKANTDARISVRKSGTEAKLRVMVESPDESKVDSLFKEIENIIS